MLEGVQETITGLAETVGAAVVGVGRRRHVGSGIVIDKDTVLTNAHNIHNHQVAITFADGRRETGDVTGIDSDGDIAVVSVATGDVTPVAWGESSLALGSPVAALSNPGGRGLRVTVGYVSGIDRSSRGPRGRRIAGSIEHTAPLLPGSSGGPVVAADGRLLGINTNRLGEGFYMAIPTNEELRTKVGKLAAGEAPQRRYLGISVVPGHVARKMRRAVGLSDASGVLVQGVAEDGPAVAAGVTEGDMIVKVGDHEVTNVDDLHDALDAVTLGEPFVLTVLRGAAELELTATIE